MVKIVADMICGIAFLDNSVEFLFRESTDLLIPGSHGLDAERLIMLFDTALRGSNNRVIFGQSLDLFGRDKRYEATCTKLHARIHMYVDAVLKRRETSLAGNKAMRGEKAFVFIDELVHETQDRVILRDQLLNVFLPARDSAYIGASCVFHSGSIPTGREEIARRSSEHRRTGYFGAVEVVEIHEMDVEPM